MPFVTLIIPIYNAERYLRRCLDSVMEQTYADMEVLLMNDGSTDGSLAICREYEEKDLRFRTIDKNLPWRWQRIRRIFTTVLCGTNYTEKAFFWNIRFSVIPP